MGKIIKIENRMAQVENGKPEVFVPWIRLKGLARQN